MTTDDEQLAIFYNQQRSIAGANEVFMDLVREGLPRPIWRMRKRNRLKQTGSNRTRPQHAWKRSPLVS